jgi:hypothetical protein
MRRNKNRQRTENKQFCFNQRTKETLFCTAMARKYTSMALSFELELRRPPRSSPSASSGSNVLSPSEGPSGSTDISETASMAGHVVKTCRRVLALAVKNVSGLTKRTCHRTIFRKGGRHVFFELALESNCRKFSGRNRTDWLLQQRINNRGRGRKGILNLKCKRHGVMMTSCGCVCESDCLMMFCWVVDKNPGF